jgi:hypothetical protein
MVAPQFSFDAKRIAFARNVTINGAPKLALSVIDVDGINMRDLAYYDTHNTQGTPDMINQFDLWYIHTDWGKGDWVYYMCGGDGRDGNNEVCEAWRVNVNDTTQKFRVMNYGTDVARWSLSANGLYCAQDIYRDAYSFPGGSNGPRLGRFPSHNPDATLFWDDANLRRVLESNYCNSALSVSGSVMFHFAGTHNKIDFAFWDHATDKTLDNVQVLGPNDPCTQKNGGPGGVCYMAVDRWLGIEQYGIFDFNSSCANSDRWVLTDIFWGTGPFVPVAIGWKDLTAILPVNIPKVQDGVNAEGKRVFWTVWQNAYDLWVNGGPGTEGKYQDTTGNWVDIDPVGTLVDFHSVKQANSSTYKLTMVASPREAKIYYTTDGTEPTASSTLYNNAPLTYTGGANKITIKAKAISAGMPTGETVTKFVMAGSGLMATSTVTRRIEHAAERGSFVLYDLLGNKIAEGKGLHTYERLPCGTYFVRVSVNGQSVTRRLSVLSGRQAMLPLR